MSRVPRPFFGLFVAIFSLCVASSIASADQEEGSIAKWTSGDTCIFVPDGTEELVHVQLWLLDAPEKDQPMGKTVLNYMKKHPEIGEGRNVVLDKVSSDNKGRVVGKLRGAKSKKWVTAELFDTGYFWFYEPGMKNRPYEARTLKAVFEMAKKEKHGLFGYKSSVEPWKWRTMSENAKKVNWSEFKLERSGKVK